MGRAAIATRSRIRRLGRWIGERFSKQKPSPAPKKPGTVVEVTQKPFVAEEDPKKPVLVEEIPMRPPVAEVTWKPLAVEEKPVKPVVVEERPFPPSSDPTAEPLEKGDRLVWKPKSILKHPGAPKRLTPRVRFAELGWTYLIERDNMIGWGQIYHSEVVKELRSRVPVDRAYASFPHEVELSPYQPMNWVPESGLFDLDDDGDAIMRG